MVVLTSKHCDGCLEKVATKNWFLWHTVKNYITIRGDEVPTYVNYEDPTTPVRLHYCKDCWNTIVKQLPFKSEVEAF
jgi:hypothetical protein